MNQLAKVYERLQRNYSECNMDYFGGVLTIKLKNGEVVADESHAEFREEGEETQQYFGQNEDDLYQLIEEFILYMRAGGAPAARPEEEKQQRNPTYRTVAQTWKKTGGRLLLILGVTEMLIFIGAVSLGKGLWLLLLFVCWSSFSLVPLFFARKKNLAKYWVCPSCGAALPVSRKGLTMEIQYTASCPACGSNLETVPMPEPEEVNFHEEKHQNKMPYRQQPVIPETASKWPGRVSGVMILLYTLLAGITTLASIGESSVSSLLLVAFMHVPLFLLALALLLCRGPRPEELLRPTGMVRERKGIRILGFLTWPVGVLFIFCASAVAAVEPPDIPVVLLLFSVGLLLVLVGVWALLAVQNRELRLYENGGAVYVTSWGRQKHFLPGQIASVTLHANDSIRFRDSKGKKLFAVERNMWGMEQLADWIEAQDFPAGMTRQKEKQVEKEEGIEPVVQWREEYNSRWQGHLKAIRVGLILVLFLFFFGCAAPFFLYASNWIKYSTMVYLTAFSFLPLLVYYLIFAEVLTLDRKPKGATEEWKSRHLTVSAIWLLLPTLWMIGLFYYVLNKAALQIVDHMPFAALWLGIGIVLCAAVILRTPKRLRGEGLVIFCFVVLGLSYSMAYGLNLRLCSPTVHYPAKVIEHEIQQEEEDEEPDYFLTVILDDGKKEEFSVFEEVYRLEEAGAELQVCQKKSLLGIRMAKLHLPEE